MGASAGYLNWLNSPQYQQAQQLKMLRAAAGNPALAAQMGLNPMLPQQMPVPIAPQPGQASVPNQPPQAGAQGGMPPPPMGAQQPPQQAQGWQPMPSTPPQAQGASQPMPPPSAPPQGGIAPPPMGGAADAGTPQSLQQIPPQLQSFTGFMDAAQKAGIPEDQALQYYQQAMPYIQDQQKRELEQYRLQVEARKAAVAEYWKTMNTQSLIEHRQVQEGQGQERIDKKGAGAASGFKNTEFVYPKGADGRPDETQPPLGTRNVTKDGRIVFMDSSGKQVKSLVGGTAKEGKDTKASAGQAVRQGIVKAAVTNSLARLDEIDKKFGDSVTTSAFFGQHADNPLTRGAYGVAKSSQSKQQQEADSDWSSFIDEAIPVFTGGLRGSDAFRRFLIEQAPGPGDKPETVKEKKRLFRQNIEGTSKAFFNKFSTDPTMQAPGTKPEDIQSAAPASSEWKIEKVQ